MKMSKVFKLPLEGRPLCLPNEDRDRCEYVLAGWKVLHYGKDMTKQTAEAICLAVNQYDQLLLDIQLLLKALEPLSVITRDNIFTPKELIDKMSINTAAMRVAAQTFQTISKKYGE